MYKQDTYGQYNIIGEPVIPSQVEGIEYRLKAKNRQTPLESPQVLQVIVSEKALLTRFSREFEPEEIAWQEGLARIHGLLDFGFFQESNEYRWIVTSKSETDTVEPPLTLEAPDFGDDSERWISYHILSALRRARRELPREYTRKKLDPEGACAILEIDRTRFEYIVGRLGERSWIARMQLVTDTGRILSHGNLFDGGFYITEEGMQAFEDMERSQAKPQRITKRKISMEQWDIFISHATEDQDQVARPLAEALQREGLKVWYAEFSLTLGDSLRRSIDRGLAGSRYGVVILSPSFFQKEWPQKELDGLVSREVDGKKRILPVWHQVGRDDIAKFSPMLADRVGISTDKGIPAIVTEILRAMEPKASSPLTTPRLAVPSPERLESPTVTLNYEEMYISQHIHKYRLVAKFTNTLPEAQDGFRFEVFLPARIPKESNGFHFEKDVQIDHEFYSPSVYESSQRVFPGQTIEICGKETEVYLEYEMNHDLYWDLSSRPVQVIWKLYLPKAPIREGKVPFKDLHCF